MQEELDLDYPQLNIQILAIDKISAGGVGVSSFSSSLDLPMVVDNSSDNIWANWGGIWRDIVILDANNEIYDTYNLTQNSLSNATNFATLKQLFIDAASQ